jgi:U4/U6.U5 tri-snRNP-associated protein 2
MEPYTQKNESVIYDLIANVTHEINTTSEEEKKSTKHSWRIQILDKSRDRWLQIQDLVVEEVRRELLFLSESYIQVWERRRE